MLEQYEKKDHTIKTPINPVVDQLLGGGIESRTITQFYGPPASGKTNLCLISAVKFAQQGRKVIYIDTEGGYSVERLKQIAPKDLEPILEKTFIYEPTNFSDQQFIIDNLDQIMGEDIGLIILDSAVALYRTERREDNATELSRSLGVQLSKLSALSRQHNLAVIITSQVYSSFDSVNEFEPVGGSVLKYWSKVTLELKKDGACIEASLIRHRELPEGLKARFRITSKGIEDAG